MNYFDTSILNKILWLGWTQHYQHHTTSHILIINIEILIIMIMIIIIIMIMIES